MLRSRSVIAFVILVAVLSVLVILLHLVREPDGGGQRQDSYGVVPSGYRGMVDTLHALDIPVSRSLVPPPATLDPARTTLVLWEPIPSVLCTERNHLLRLHTWVERGGHLVVALPSEWNDVLFAPEACSCMEGACGEAPSPPETDDGTPSSEVGSESHAASPEEAQPEEQAVDFMSFLNREGVSLSTWRPGSGTIRDGGSPEDAPEGISIPRLRVVRDPPARPTHSLPVQGKGRYAGIAERLRVPGGSLHALQLPASSPAERVWAESPAGAERILLARFPHGAGAVTVVAEPALIANAYLAGDDNALLLTRVLAGEGRAVVFDEFFHGLTVRGNPFWLLTRAPWGWCALVATLLLGVWLWREAVRLGGALEMPPASRRTVKEYLDAMAWLFVRSGKRRFLLQQILRGALWEYGQRLNLPPTQATTGDIDGVLRRRNPEAADRFLTAARNIETLLQGQEALQAEAFRNAAKEMVACLSK